MASYVGQKVNSLLGFDFHNLAAIFEKKMG